MSSIAGLRYKLFGKMLINGVRSGRREAKLFGPPAAPVVDFYAPEFRLKGDRNARHPHADHFAEKKMFRDQRGLLKTRKGAGKRSKKKK